MTVSSTNVDDLYSGNGSTTVFSYTFKILSASDILVKLRNDFFETEYTKTLNSDYTVTGVGETSGGTVVFTTPPANGETVVITRVTPITQSTDYVENDAFLAESHEAALDRLTFIAQEVKDIAERSVRFSTGAAPSGLYALSNSTTTRADKYIGFNSAGNLVVKDPADIVNDTTPKLGGDLNLNSNDIIGTGNLNITGHISLTGTVDGRNVSADGALLDTAMQNLVDDTTPQLGGNLDINNQDIYLDGTEAFISFTNSYENIVIRNTNTTGIENSINLDSAGLVKLRHWTGVSTEDMIIANGDGNVELYYNGSKKLETKADGVDIVGELQSDSLDVDGNADITGNLILGGNLTVSGTTTTVNTETINLADNIITLNSNETGTPSQNAGMEVERGTSANRSFLWNESNDYWQADTDFNVQGDITVTGTVDGRDLATDGTKLDGIEVNADVTDTANVTAAGALMDSEVTNLAQVKAFDSADYATAAQGTLADSALQNLVDDTTPQLGGTLDTNSNNITFADGSKAIFGTGSDLQIYHLDGAFNLDYIDSSGTGGLQISTDANFFLKHGTDSAIQSTVNGSVDLYYDNSKKIETTSTGVDVTGTITFDGGTTSADLNLDANDLILNDSGSSDAKLFFNASQGNIVLRNQNTGGSQNSINLDCEGPIQLRRYTSFDPMLIATPQGSVDLYYNNALKLATKSDGIGVTGEVECDSLDVDGAIDLDITTSGDAIHLNSFSTDGLTGPNITFNRTGQNEGGALEWVGGHQYAPFRYASIEGYRENASVPGYNGSVRFKNADANTTTLTERMRMNQYGIVVNEDGDAGTDFRVESDSNVAMLFVDSSANAIGINNSNPSSELDVTGDIAVSGSVIATGQRELLNEYTSFQSNSVIIGPPTSTDQTLYSAYEYEIEVTSSSTQYLLFDQRYWNGSSWAVMGSSQRLVMDYMGYGLNAGTYQSNFGSSFWYMVYPSTSYRLNSGDHVFVTGRLYLPAGDETTNNRTPCTSEWTLTHRNSLNYEMRYDNRVVSSSNWNQITGLANDAVQGIQIYNTHTNFTWKGRIWGIRR